MRSSFALLVLTGALAIAGCGVELTVAVPPFWRDERGRRLPPGVYWLRSDGWQTLEPARIVRLQ